MEALAINTDTHKIEGSRENTEVPPTFSLAAIQHTAVQATFKHPSDEEASKALQEFDLELKDIADALKNIKAHHTQVINNPFNYSGGKYKLLPQIIPLIPNTTNTFYDVFGGAGTMGINVEAKNIIYNELDENLSNLVKSLSEGTYRKNYKKIQEVIRKYNLSEYLLKKNDTLQSNYKQLVEDFNNSNEKPWAMFFVIVILSFNSMIIYKKGEEKNIDDAYGKRSIAKSIKAKFILFSKKLIENKHKYTFHNRLLAKLKI